MVEQWSPKPEVKGSNPFSPENNIYQNGNRSISIDFINLLQSNWIHYVNLSHNDLIDFVDHATYIFLSRLHNDTLKV